MSYIYYSIFAIFICKILCCDFLDSSYIIVSWYDYVTALLLFHAQYYFVHIIYIYCNFNILANVIGLNIWSMMSA